MIYDCHARIVNYSRIIMVISKAFDSISWVVYLLETLQALGFGQKWRDWIAALLATSSSRVLLNAKPGKNVIIIRSGDLALVNCVLTSQPIYHLKVFPAQK